MSLLIVVHVYELHYALSEMYVVHCRVQSTGTA